LGVLRVPRPRLGLDLKAAGSAAPADRAGTGKFQGDTAYGRPAD
jgi:hypothetical protein